LARLRGKEGIPATAEITANLPLFPSFWDSQTNHPIQTQMIGIPFSLMIDPSPPPIFPPLKHFSIEEELDSSIIYMKL
jgi:hypothetical protein